MHTVCYFLDKQNMLMINFFIVFIPKKLIYGMNNDLQYDIIK